MSKIRARQLLGRGAPWILVLSLALAACASGPDPLADKAFVTDEACAAPCWHGLQLGSSTKGAALSLLPTLPFVEAGSIADQATSWQSDATARQVSFGCLHPRKGNCGSLIFAGDRLRSVQLSVDYSLTLSMMVDKLGTPAHLDYVSSNSQSCSVTAAWPAKNIGATLDNLADGVCQKLHMGQGISSVVKVTGLTYTDGQVLQAGPESCCGRLSWPGFAD